MFNRSLIASLFLAVSAFASPGAAQAATTAVPCFAKTKGVIANTGQGIYNANSTVQGDVEAGGAIVKNGNAIITGTQKANMPAGLAVVPVPAGAKNLGNFVVSGTVTLQPGNYVASSFNMNSGANLKVTGLVQIWVTGSMVLASTANAGGDPTNLEFLMTSNQSVNVNGGADITAFIYAPAASAIVSGTVTGSLVGSTTTINSGGHVKFVSGSQCSE